MIRDQFVEHIASHRIREKLLLESGLTLEKAITLATETEAATAQAKTISGEQQITVQTVRSKPTVKSIGRRCPQPVRMPAAAGQRGKPHSSVTRSCYRCGSEQHLANAKDCPAATAMCKKQ
ncbi:hypothetical protein LDENG_00187990 [Lucifuga dentata]|nr:hypothetical protein LDENG_00187990 [Lucifuga dentata]